MDFFLVTRSLSLALSKINKNISLGKGYKKRKKDVSGTKVFHVQAISLAASPLLPWLRNMVDSRVQVKAEPQDAEESICYLNTCSHPGCG